MALLGPGSSVASNSIGYCLSPSVRLVKIWILLPLHLHLLPSPHSSSHLHLCKLFVPRSSVFSCIYAVFSTWMCFPSVSHPLPSGEIFHGLVKCETPVTPSFEFTEPLIHISTMDPISVYYSSLLGRLFYHCELFGSNDTLYPECQHNDCHVESVYGCPLNKREGN